MIAFYRRSTRSWRKPVTNPTVGDGELEYHEECWGATRSMGERYWKPHKMNPAGVVPARLSMWPQEVYDVRIVSPEDEIVIRDYDQQIAKLQSERLAFVKDRFKAWQIPTKDDCVKIHQGKSQEEAQTDATRHNQEEHVSVRQAQGEQKMVRDLNKTIGKVFKA